MRRSGKRRMSPTAAMNVAATITLTPGTVISRLTSGQPSASAAINFSTSAISESRKSTCRTAEATVSPSVSGSCCSASQRRPLTPNRSAAGGRSFKQRINTAWISFFARERARTNCERRASRRRIARIRSSGVHTPSSWPAHNSLASARASRRSVLALACRIPVSLGETTITRATCGSRIRAISHALPVTSNATQSRASRLCPNSSSASGLASIRPADRSRPSATIATSQKSRCTSSATALTRLLTVADRAGEPVGKRHRRIRARSATGQVAGAATEKPGL